mgnify:CR=1 FL=1|tara:strand:+ start:375 stop:713 length:339 start_codon:yes stop_codon:yes gene_type:complete
MAIFNTNLIVHTGTDFEQTFVLEDDRTNSAKNLGGYTGYARMRRYPASLDFTAFTLIFTNRPLGKIRISLTDDVTADLKAGKYFYDVCLKDGTNVECVIEGEVIVKRTVTRP